MPDTEKLPDSLPEFISWLDTKNISRNLYTTYIDRFLDNKAREKGVPLSCKFELTPLCNLDCRMCYVHLNGEQMKNEKVLPVEFWKKIAKDAIEMGMRKAALSGGECLVYPGFDELYLYLHSFGVEISVFTNGILLDEKRVEFFKKHPPKLIQVSLYGSDEETYEEVTGHRQFSRVIRNIRNADKNGLPVMIAITPSRYTVGKGEDIVRTAHGLGIPVKINYALIEPREGTDRKGNDIEAPLDEYVRMNKLNAELNGMDIMPVDETALPDLGADAGRKEYGFLCGAGRSNFDMDWKGLMHPCTNLLDIVSDPAEVGFEKAWEEINRIANSFPRPVECTDCEYNSVCLQCIAMHLQGAPKDNRLCLLFPLLNRTCQQLIPLRKRNVGF